MFFGLEDGRAHLCCGSEAPLLRAVQAAFDSYANARAAGHAGRRVLEAAREEARQRIATLLNVPEQAAQIAFFASASHALDVIGRSLPWREGDEILTLADEYPSVILAWHWLAATGVRTKLIEGGATPEDALIAAATPRTRAVRISHVSYRTGLRLDLARLSAALRPRGVRLVVDASHSLGVLAVDATLCDALVSCGHKFMLGLHGTGIFYVNRDAVQPGSAGLGWYGVTGFHVSEGAPDYALKPGAAAYEMGNPAFLPLLALNASLQTLAEAGHTAIAAHAIGLAARLRDGLRQYGIASSTPAAPGRHGSSVAIRGAAGARLHAALAARGILAALDHERLRLSFHGYNTQNEVDAVLATASGIA